MRRIEVLLSSLKYRVGEKRQKGKDKKDQDQINIDKFFRSFASVRESEREMKGGRVSYSEVINRPAPSPQPDFSGVYDSNAYTKAIPSGTACVLYTIVSIRVRPVCAH